MATHSSILAWKISWREEPGGLQSTGLQTEDPSGCGAASPSQGRWDPDSLRTALRLGVQATAGDAQHRGPSQAGDRSPQSGAGDSLLPTSREGRSVEPCPVATGAAHSIRCRVIP